MAPARPSRATKLFQLLLFCAGGAVLMVLRAGKEARGKARRALWRAINRGAVRNMVARQETTEGKEREVAMGVVELCAAFAVVTLGKLAAFLGPVLLSSETATDGGAIIQ